MFLVFWIARCLVRLRYRIEVKGAKDVFNQICASDRSDGSKQGILFLPNHPAEIDPVILMLLLWKRFHVRPLVVEHFYTLKGLGFLMKKVKAVPLPTMDVFANQWKARQVEKQFKKIAADVKAGENFLIYPAGRLKLQKKEVLGGASLVHDLLGQCEGAQIVLIRTTGLWGSRFSRALTGSVPPFGKTLLEGLKIILKNGIFFTPRRRVTIEFARAPSNFPFQGTRLELNQFLEMWYNRVPDPLVRVSCLFWKQELAPVTAQEVVRSQQELLPVPIEVEREVYTYLSKLARRPYEEITQDMHLARDLGLDSLDITQLHIFLEDRFGVHVAPEHVRTAQDALQAAAGHGEQRSSTSTASSLPAWPEANKYPVKRPAPIEPLGKTLQEAFLLMCERMGKAVACADGLSGVWTYQQLKQRVLILTLALKKHPGLYIGILLPSSTVTYALVLACLCAKKVPVMLNWTAGVRSLNHAVELLELNVVLSSRRFLNQMENGDLGLVDDRLVLLEDIREGIDWKMKLKGLLMSLRSPKALMHELELEAIQETDAAVVLFTSGTEALPKAVPLSHRNILSDQKAAFSCAQFVPDEIMYSVLPPFHAFGFSTTGLLPLVCGIKCCYAPDPTDSYGLARDIAHWKATLFCCTPSFIQAVLSVASAEAFRSMRLLVSGAEKAPQSLFDKVRALRESLGTSLELIEGYGITECGPVVTLTPPGTPPGQGPVGVGKLLPGMEMCTLDSETMQQLPEGKEGEICLRGPNIFSGYLGHSASPFITLDGKPWYRSGDRGYLDEKKNLILTGRLKRFIKIGGEMVSLSGLEEEIVKLAHSLNWSKIPQSQGKEGGSAVAIISREVQGEKGAILLFTTYNVTKEDVNSALKQCGYGRIVKIAAVKHLEEIPLTGTGKTHYRLLEEIT